MTTATTAHLLRGRRERMFVSEAFRIDESDLGPMQPTAISPPYDRVRLADQLRLAIDALPLTPDGPDELVSRIAGDLGVTHSDVVILKLRSSHRGFTLAMATTQAWELKKRALCAMKHAARLERRRVLLAPAGQLRRPIFMANCATLSFSLRAAASATERMAILDYVAQDPGASLRDCAELVANSKDPYAVVLSLVATGLLRLDLGRRITPDVRISPVRRHDVPAH